MRNNISIVKFTRHLLQNEFYVSNNGILKKRNWKIMSQVYRSIIKYLTIDNIIDT